MLSGKTITTIKKQSKKIIEAINTLEAAVKNVTNTQNGSISNTNTSLSSFISTFNSWRSSWTSTRAGKIDTIESRLTDARAKKLDNLDYSISNLKSGLQNKVEEAKLVIEDLGDRLTTKRTKNLDNLDTTVSSRADQITASSILSKVNQGMVKRVQRGLIEQFNNVNVSKILVKNGGGSSPWVITTLRSVNVTLPYSVNPNKSISTCEWSRAIKEGYGGTLGVTCRLTGLNTITFDIMYVEYISSSVNNPQPKAEVDIQTYVTWQVIEYY